MKPRGWLPAIAPIASVVLIGVLAALREALERSMVLHMLVQLPVLVAAGVILGQVGAPFLGRLVARYDEHGITGLFTIMFVSAYWMIPRALESVLTSAPAELAKFASCILAGLLLPGMLQRANTVTQVFFVGNFASMMAIVGLLFQDAPQRLCNYYLLDDQVWAGTGLVIYALAIALVWAWRAWIKSGRAQRA
jgi:hypothetical protein